VATKPADDRHLLLAFALMLVLEGLLPFRGAERLA
jgi:uncharacterized protein YjeT (DUF2065 family)